jgi:hypothetical protein
MMLEENDPEKTRLLLADLQEIIVFASDETRPQNCPPSFEFYGLISNGFLSKA